MPDRHDVAGQPVQITVETVVLRADGTREDLGVIAYWHRNPVKRLAARLRGLGRITQPKKGA